MLCIPATSTPSERVFSAAGNTVVKKRACLDSETVDELVFLHSSLSKKSCVKAVEVPSMELPSVLVVPVKQEPKDASNAHSTVSELPTLPPQPGVSAVKVEKK